MEKTIFKIAKMDCPSEESLIRMKLDGISGISNLEFDIPKRLLTIYHIGNLAKIEKSIFDLNLEGKRLSSEEDEKIDFHEQRSQRKILFVVLGINF